MSRDPLAPLRGRPELGGVSKLLRDRHAAGETLTPDEQAQLERAQALHSDPPPPIDEAGLERLQTALAAQQRHTKNRRLHRWIGSSVGVVALAALVLLVTQTAPGPLSIRDDRTKGSHTLVVYARDAAGTVRRLLPDEAVAPGEALRFEVTPRGPRYVAIVGLDSVGTAGVYAPLTGDPPRLEAIHTFDGSLVLDTTSGRERITAVFCDAPIGRRTLLEAMTALGREGFEHPLAIGCDEVTLFFPKTP